MNLIQQFPDISKKIRTKKEMDDRNYRPVKAKQSLGDIEDEAVVQYYEGEFRRWHIKFLFIVAATLGVVYFILLKSFWIYSLINIR